jgi:homoserine dehydrogenase
VALLGCGTVGREVLRLLTDQSAELAARVGTAVRLVGVAVRRPRRHPEVAAELLTTDAAELISRGEVDVVIEVIGGIEPARPLLLAALRAGRGVVTANKALLAECGPELYAAADAAGTDLYFEAAVAPWATPRPTRPRTWTATTPHRRPPSSRRWPFTPE